MESIDIWINLVSNVGFPIIVAAVLLRNLMSNIQEKLENLNTIMNELLQTIKEQKKK